MFDTIREARPLLYIQTGDLFYANIDRDRDRSFLDAFDATLSSPAQAALYRSVPVAYTWDDHDYGPNDADRTSPSRPAALAAYRRLVPHGTFALAGAEAPVAQAFTVGRVRFIITDSRSQRVPASTPGRARQDGAGRTPAGVAPGRGGGRDARRTAAGVGPLHRVDRPTRPRHRRVAGVRLGAAAHRGRPDHWRVHFSVASTDDAIARALELGGTVLHPAHDTPYGRLAILSDPTGASFSLVGG